MFLYCICTLSIRSVKWWDKELRQFMKDRRACFARGLGHESDWNDRLTICKE